MIECLLVGEEFVVYFLEFVLIGAFFGFLVGVLLIFRLVMIFVLGSWWGCC